MMKYPTSDSIREVIRILKAGKDDGVDRIDMLAGYVPENYCGTLICHAGAFVVGMRKLGIAFDDNKTYVDGAKAMINILGFNSSKSFYEWISDKANWGNCEGNAIFVSRIAFAHRTKRPGGCRTLDDIIDHWENEVLVRRLDQERNKIM